MLTSTETTEETLALETEKQTDPQTSTTSSPVSETSAGENSLGGLQTSMEGSYVAVRKATTRTAKTAKDKGEAVTTPRKVVGGSKAITMEEDTLPTDGDYSTLKDYWSKAASINTPTGLNPEDVAKRIEKNRFTFADKTVARKQGEDSRKARTEQSLQPDHSREGE